MNRKRAISIIEVNTRKTQQNAEPGSVAWGRVFESNELTDGDVFIEINVIDLDTLWTIGPIVFSDGNVHHESYTTNRYEQAVDLLAAALSY